MSKRKLNKERHIQDIYFNQKQSSIKRGIKPPSYTKQELQEWCLNKPIYHKLHADWVASGFIRALAPSIDRIDDYDGYTLNNLQIMTAKENLDKGFKDRFNGINTKISKGVYQLDSEGKILNAYPSCNAAGRAMGAVNGSDISRACLSETRTAYGFNWKHQ